MKEFKSKIGLWALAAGFPVLSLRRPRRALGLYGGRKGRLLHWVPLCDWCGPVGLRLCAVAFRWCATPSKRGTRT